ncbi:hypothetical protein Cgig2_013370 [Carnegiea gigantea]|uniref:Uncharacterized protein n=1 Tax=Carnegiea gigantea TaxID=171969 RepID=A0A9Q1K7W9_9CARY|nr:hypothetical protein Cgig2_013370 [Carnegiea gigantea]
MRKLQPAGSVAMWPMPSDLHLRLFRVQTTPEPCHPSCGWGAGLWCWLGQPSFRRAGWWHPPFIIEQQIRSRITKLQTEPNEVVIAHGSNQLQDPKTSSGETELKFRVSRDNLASMLGFRAICRVQGGSMGDAWLVSGHSSPVFVVYDWDTDLANSSDHALKRGFYRTL